jgi:anti-sigma factor RsiW
MNCDEARILFSDRRKGSLDASVRRELEAHLTTCEACAAEARADDALAGALTRLPSRRAPDHLRRELAARFVTSPRSRLAPRLRTFAALAAGAAMAIAIVFGARAFSGDDAMLGEAVGDHLRLLYSEHPLEVASGGVHQVKPWFAGRLDFAPVVGFGGDSDYPLEGGAVALFLDRKAAAFEFKRRLHPITLFVFRSEGLHFPIATTSLGSVRATRSTSRGFHVLLWQKGDLGYALVSDVAEADLALLGEKIANSAP